MLGVSLFYLPGLALFVSLSFLQWLSFLQLSFQSGSVLFGGMLLLRFQSPFLRHPYGLSISQALGPLLLVRCALPPEASLLLWCQSRLQRPRLSVFGAFVDGGFARVLIEILDHCSERILVKKRRSETFANLCAWSLPQRLSGEKRSSPCGSCELLASPSLCASGGTRPVFSDLLPRDADASERSSAERGR